MPLFRPNPGLVYASAPPNTATELSTPLGFPCKIFSATFTSSATWRGRARRPSWDTCTWPGSCACSSGIRDGSGRGGNEMRWCRRRRAVATQAENVAELPRPAPTGSVDLTAKLNDGLNGCQPHCLIDKPRKSPFAPMCHHHIQVQERYSGGLGL